MASYGNQDVFLIGSPQITFFKAIYRRHTNFAIESIGQPFSNNVNFGEEFSIEVDKIGDLMNKIHLEFEIEQANLIKEEADYDLTRAAAENDLRIAREFYNLVNNYFIANTELLRKVNNMLKIDNLSVYEINRILQNTQYTQALTSARTALFDYLNGPKLAELNQLIAVDKFSLINEVHCFDIQKMFSTSFVNVSTDECQIFGVENEMRKKILVQKIKCNLYQKMQMFYNRFYQLFMEKKEIVDKFRRGTYVERYSSAWVEELGTSMIDIAEVKIGNEVVDRHTNYFYNAVINQLMVTPFQRENYNRVIGNIKELNTFDGQIKRKIQMLVPLQFWFSRNVGLSIPLIALRYHNVQLRFKLKKFEELFYYQRTANNLDSANLQVRNNINITGATFFTDYIFLDTDERQRFAQSTHEYLIEVVQYNEFTNLTDKEETLKLNFTQMTKYMVWFAQLNSRRFNLNGDTKCQWNNFGIRDDKTINPIENSVFRVNSNKLINHTVESSYYNHVFPYLRFENSPRDGINLYSFAILPNEIQPSSSLNLSRIKNFDLSVTFRDEFVNLANDADLNAGLPETGMYVAVYTVSYNILRIMGGIASLAFQNSLQ